MRGCPSGSYRDFSRARSGQRPYTRVDGFDCRRQDPVDIACEFQKKHLPLVGAQSGFRVSLLQLPKACRRFRLTGVVHLVFEREKCLTPSLRLLDLKPNGFRGRGDLIEPLSALFPAFAD